MGWDIFRELYVKIIFSILAVVAAMLLLQGVLNHLKLRAWVAEATSSRYQIAAGTIEASIVQAETFGLAIEQMSGLQRVIDREREQDPSVVHIWVVSPNGVALLSSGALSISSKELDRVLHRILGGHDKNTRFDVGDRLYTGRQIYDSNDAIMGAIVMATETEAYLADAKQSFFQLRVIYASIFVLCSVLLVPLVMVLFGGVRPALKVLESNLDDGLTLVPNTHEAAELQAMLVEGADKVVQVEQELLRILDADSDPTGAVK